MNIRKEYINKFLLVLCTVIISALSAEAANNSLLAIDVKQINNDNYNVVLKLNGNSNIKKTINSSNIITITLNSTLPSDTMEIIYDNTSGINNVTVQKKNSENTVIVLEGKNISNAGIYTKDISTGIINPIIDKTLFFGVNKNMLNFSVCTMLICFFAMLFIKPKRKSMQNKLNKSLLNNTLNTKTTPSISYNTTNSYASIPKDFIINDYMQDERIKKAG